jgi:hypothetical protein
MLPLLIIERGVMHVQAVGGAVAVVVGAYMTNFIGPDSSGRAIYGEISLQDSILEFQRNRFINCTSISVTDSSLGTSSVFGGALAILQLPQVSNFELALLQAKIAASVNGFNVTVVISESHFLQCSVFSNASFGRLGEADGGGGAIFAKSVALTNFSLANSIFNGITVSVASGATGLPSFSSGGALAVEAGFSNSSFLTISSSSFFNCTVQGANIANMGVIGGAVHVFRAAYISVVQSIFTNCSVLDADSSSVVAKAISGGSAMSAVVTRNMSVLECVFDASGGRDASQTSAGLLVLARNASSAQINVSSCSFISAEVVMSVQCVGGDGFRRFVGLCVGLNMLFRHSRVIAVSSQSDVSRFSATGNDLMTFYHQDAVLFTGSRLHCALPVFAAFNTETRKSSARSTVYSCRPCPSYQISLTASAVSLEDLSNSKNTDRCYSAVPNSSETSVCPFAVPDCTTFVNVSRGFWTNMSETGHLEAARRCPRGYCGCAQAVKGQCPLPPLISINRNRDPLCIGNRIGKLCGGCPPNFTQSMDDSTCISNEACSKSLWWVWTLSMLGFAVYSLYIVLSCLKLSDGAFACLVFYFQMSSFLADDNQPDGLVAILEYAQVHSVAAMYRDACYAPSMSAYNATAFKLIGPLLVLLFAVAWTWIIQKLQPRLQQRNIDISVSYSGTLAVTVLFVFSNVSNVVFTLVECSSYSGPDAVVFIDGTEQCMDAKWSVLVFVAVLLFLFPVAFVAALRLKKGFQRARDAVSGKFTGPAFYWGAVTLSFRLFISAAQFLRVDYPNLMVFVRMVLSVGVFSLLLYLRPYVYVRAFLVDVACFVCLIAQFGLQIFSRTREFLGVAESSMTKSFFTEVLIWSSVIR